MHPPTGLASTLLGLLTLPVQAWVMPCPRCCSLQAYVSACLQRANSTAGAVEAIGGQVAFLRQRVIDLGLDKKQPGVLQARFGGDQEQAAEQHLFGA